MVYDNSDRRLVFGCRAQHGWAANVDILNGLGPSTAGPGNGLRKGVEVYGDKINGSDIMGSHLVIIDATTTQQATVDARV